MLVVSLLAACGPEATDEDDREFANLTPPAVQTATTSITGSPIASSPVGTVPGLATPDPATLFIAPAAPTTAFFVVEGALLLVGADGTPQPVELTGPVDAFSVAPGGESVAVLFRPVSTDPAPATPLATTPTAPDAATTATPTAPVSLAVIGSDGAVIRQVDDIAARFAAMPDVRGAVSTDATIATLALGPAPDDLLVAYEDGLLVQVPVTGEPAVVRGSGNLVAVSQVSWSPDGKGLAIVAAGRPGEPAAVYFTALRPDGIDPVRVAPAPGRTTGEVAWLPDGSGILFVDAAGPLDATTLRSGRDLFVTPLRSDRRMLVAAAGVIGPAAGVVQFAPSPNGAVAYALYRAEGAEVRFNSLWVGSIDGQTTVPINLTDTADILGLAWTAAGLVVLSEPSSGGEPVTLLVGPDGVARPAVGGPPATPSS